MRWPKLMRICQNFRKFSTSSNSSGRANAGSVNKQRVPPKFRVAEDPFATASSLRNLLVLTTTRHADTHALLGLIFCFVPLNSAMDGERYHGFRSLGIEPVRSLWVSLGRFFFVQSLAGN